MIEARPKPKFTCGAKPVVYPSVKVVRGHEKTWTSLGWEVTKQRAGAPSVLEWRKGGEPVRPCRPGGSR